MAERDQVLVGGVTVRADEHLDPPGQLGVRRGGSHSRQHRVLLDSRRRAGEGRFVGRRVVLFLVLGILMVPGMVTFVPLFILVSNLGLTSTGSC
jgi:hypothetical protein